MDALDHFPLLLVELVRSDAPHSMLTDEGFTSFEVSAVMALVERERAQSGAPAQAEAGSAVTALSG